MWDPYRQDQIDSIEAVQRRAARFIKKDYSRSSSVTNMLKSLDIDLLKDRHIAHHLNIFYLAVNNLIVLPIPNYFPPKQCVTRFFAKDTFILASYNHDYHYHSFYPRTIRDRNAPPQDIRTYITASILKSHCLEACRCD